MRAERGGAARLSKDEESQLVIKAMRVNTVSKLTHDDSTLFAGIVADVFPGVNPRDIAYEELERAVREELERRNLVAIDSRIKKVMQFYEAVKQRTGVVLVGPSGSGKTTVWRILRDALRRTGRSITDYVVNPKAMPRRQLLGYMDMDTREWHDGILTANARKVVKEAADHLSWIICDGDIDPEWVESLNSVLDDNKLMTMPNGERVRFANNVNFVFETHSLKYASPATVSRMGMIFLSNDDVGPESLVESWLKTRPEERRLALKGWLKSYFFETVRKVMSLGEHAVDTTIMGIVKSGLSHLELVETKGEFVVALVRGLSGYACAKDRDSFARDVFALCGDGNLVDPAKALNYYFLAEENRYERYKYDDTASLDPDALATRQIVHTVDVQRTIDIVSPWLNMSKPFLLVGPEGAGKDMVLRSCFGELKNAQVATVHCNSRSKARHAIRKLVRCCNTFRTNQGRVLRPKDSDRLVLYFKDLNLPRPDEYGTTRLLSFLRRIISYQGYYDENLEWVGIEKVRIVATMNPATTVGRYPLSTRFTSIVGVCSIEYPAKDRLVSIYKQFIRAVFSGTDKLSRHPVWSKPANVETLSRMLVDLYAAVKDKFRIDDSPRYLFTPRDLTRIVQGLLRYEYEFSDKADEIIGCVLYEARRLFCDRLVSKSVRDAYDAEEQRALAKFASAGVQIARYSLFSTYFNVVDVRTSSGADKGRNGAAAAVYRPVNARLRCVARRRLAEVISEMLKGYTRENRKLRMFLTADTVDMIARIDRAMSLPGGSLLLVGRPGVGRLNTVLVCAFKLGVETFSPKITADYGIKNFENDMKQLLTKAGIENKHMCLVLEDHRILRPTFLEYVNSLLSSGEIPGLFSPEELDRMLAPLRERRTQEDFVGSTYRFFASRVHRNLRIALIMDPTNSSFAMRCRSNPAIFTKCYIMWMESWARGRFVRVPRTVIGKRDLALLGSGDEKKIRRLLTSMSRIHESLGATGATPLRYLRFVDTFRFVYLNKRKSKDERRKHLEQGLKKLLEASSDVDRLSREAQKRKELLARKQEQKAKALERIRESMRMSVAETAEIENIKRKISVEEVKLKERRDKVNAKLSLIQPSIDAAKSAVNALSKRDLDEIRSLAMPPEAIRDVLEGVLRLLGVTDTSWKGMKNFLGKTGVKDQIMFFDAHEITRTIAARVKDFINTKKRSFDDATIERVSKAAAPLAKWTKANVEYSEVLRTVAPLEHEMAELDKSRRVFRAKLERCEKKLDMLNKRVKELQDEFETKTSEAESLKVGVQRAEATLNKARSLIGKLSGEKDRWEKQVQAETKLAESLPMYCLLAAAFIVYLPGLAETTRNDMLSRWKQDLDVGDFDLKTFMSSESALLRYKAEGLPGDDLSMENAVVLLEMVETPLVIDPARQATSWLKSHLKDSNLEVTNFREANFVNKLELAVRFGKTLLIQEVDRIEPILFPLLRREIIRRGTRKSIYIGEKLVDYREEFRMYLVTRNPNIRLTPDSASLVTRVNFTVTRSGLEGQLLGITIRRENPELESKKSDLLRREEDDKIRLSELEKRLLTELASSKGNLLENDSLIEKLNEIKQKSGIIVRSLEEASRLRVELDAKREAYRPFAKNGSTLFFIIKDLRRISHMYRFSLPVFLKLFRRALLDPAGRAVNLDARIALLSEKLQRIVYRYISRSLFKQDHLMFAMHVVKGLFSDLFTPRRWGFFVGTDMSAVRECDPPRWISGDRADAFKALNSALPDLVRNANLYNRRQWDRWGKSTNCFGEFPDANRLTPFERLLVIKTLRPDQLYNGMNSFVCRRLNISSTSPPTINLQAIARDECSARDPILIVTTIGADPSQELEDAASKTVGRRRFYRMALGQGQTNEAISALRKCAQNGDWLCLKNLHLVVDWLPVLEKEISMLEPNKSFRLWMTTEATDSFPVILLQRSLKITFESPPGIKNNLVSTYERWDADFLARNNRLARSRLMFVLAWFHAIVQERRSYIPQGWTKFYEFSTADLRSAADVIEAACAGRQEPDWPTIYGLLENAIYGGRIDDNFDLRVLRAYLKKFFNPSLLGGRGPKLNIYRDVAVPRSMSHREHAQIVARQVPDLNSPELFGLPVNADRLVMASESSRVVDKLKLLTLASARGSVSDGASSSAAPGSKDLDRDELDRVGGICSFWKGLTGSHADELFFGASKSTQLSSTMPLDVFVRLEYQNALSLVNFINSSLNDINSVIQGRSLMTPVTRRYARDLANGQVPRKWLDRWDGPERIRAWLGHVVRKTLKLREWKRIMERKALATATLRLNDLFHPDVFLNAFRQRTARATNRPLDELTELVASWTTSSGSPASNNPYASVVAKSALKVRVSGLLLQGCSFDGAAITDLAVDSPSVVDAPLCELAWVTAKQLPQNIADSTISVPVYFFPTRERLLVALSIPCTDKQKYELSGLACFVDRLDLT